MVNRLIEKLSEKNLYIKENNLKDIYELYQSNEYYSKIPDNYPVKEEAILEDINDIPTFIRKEQKHFLSIYNKENKLVAVLDYLDGYSFQNNQNAQAVWIGLLQINKQFHRAGIGRLIMSTIEEVCKECGKKIIQLGVIRKNEVGYNFWMKQGFKTFKKGENNKYSLYLMEKKIGD